MRTLETHEGAKLGSRGRTFASPQSWNRAISEVTRNAPLLAILCACID